MLAGRITVCIPYLICLAAAAVLWWLTGQITYSARAGQIGPEFWPRVAIGVMAAASLFEIARNLFSSAPGREVSGIGEALEKDAGAEDDEAPRVPSLLIAGIVLTLGFAVVVTTLGFVLSTFVYLVLFMYVGRYRNHTVIWLSAVLGTLIFAAIFLKLVYVSVPRGTPPFDSVTQAVLDLLGVLF